MGVERTAKVTRVVEMEWASRVTVAQTDAPSPDRRIGEPSTSSKHPRGDHPSRTGSCVPGWSWTHTLTKHAWSLANDVAGTAPASVGAASRPHRLARSHRPR